MRWLYTLALYLALPLVLIRLAWRARHSPAYARRWGERLGFGPALTTDRTVVWLHTVSVGEFLGALPMIRALQQQPDVQLVITTTTPTGSERVLQTLGDSVHHVYAPYDLPGCLARFLRRIQPRALIIMETELWPNTIAACRRREVPVLLVNARLSERSAAGYRRVRAIAAPMLRQLTVAAIQHDDDAARFRALGLPGEKTLVTGNIKFDLTLEAGLREQAEKLRAQWSDGGRRPVWIAASTHEGEDELLLSACERLWETPAGQDLLLVLVPRHPERFARVGQLCEGRHLSVARRSRRDPVGAQTRVVLGDTMGELLLLYGTADMAFVGGSLVPNGGHNLIEPAAWGLPLISGSHLFNFAEVARLMEDAGALQLADSVEELAGEVGALLDDPSERQRRGQAALSAAEANRGALEKTLTLIRQYVS